MVKQVVKKRFTSISVFYDNDSVKNTIKYLLNFLSLNKFRILLMVHKEMTICMEMIWMSNVLFNSISLLKFRFLWMVPREMTLFVYMIWMSTMEAVVTVSVIMVKSRISSIFPKVICLIILYLECFHVEFLFIDENYNWAKMSF